MLPPGSRPRGSQGEAVLTPAALLPEVTPAPHTPLHPHSQTPLAQPYAEGPPPTTEASASSCHPAQLSRAPSLPADQKRGERLKSVCRGPGLPSGEAAQPFQAEAGDSRDEHSQSQPRRPHERPWPPSTALSASPGASPTAG